MKVLVTGFGPFDRFRTNPTEELVSSLSAGSEGICQLVLPVIYGEAGKVLLGELERTQPDLIISFGLNPTIGQIALEEVALNLRASEVPDNTGRRAVDEPVQLDGPLALRSLLPNRRTLERLRNEGIPARLSYSAGVYLCNEVFYMLLRWCGENGRKGGFVHVPLTSEMVVKDASLSHCQSLSSEILHRASRIVVEEALRGIS